MGPVIISLSLEAVELFWLSQLNLPDLHHRPCSILMIPLLGRRFCIVSPSLYTLLATTDPHSVPLKTT